MAINIIKSVLFNLHFYILTFLLIIVMSPVLILPFWFIKIIAKIWGKILVFGMKIWLGLNLKIIGNYLDKNWKLKKNFSKNISSNHLDKIYRSAIDNGCYGGKLLGAGGGGFFLFICDFCKAFCRIKFSPAL